MQKAFLISFFLLLTILVFSIGVFSSLQGEIGGIPSFHIQKHKKTFLSNNDNPEKALRFKNQNFKKLSGNKTAINGIPIEMWSNEVFGKFSSVVHYYKNKWKNNGWIVTENHDDKSSFVNTIDIKSKKFLGAFTYGNNQTTIMPFSIDMSKKNKDVWDNDMPDSLSKKKGIHMTSEDNEYFFEKFFYVERFPLSQAESNIKSIFGAKGWDLKHKMDKNLDGKEQYILCFSKNNKNCVINIMTTNLKDYKGASLISLFMIAPNKV